MPQSPVSIADFRQHARPLAVKIGETPFDGRPFRTQCLFFPEWTAAVRTWGLVVP